MPAAVRKRLGVGPGSVVEWAEADGVVVVRRAGGADLRDTRQALGFEQPAAPAASLTELREGVRDHVRRRHARR